MDDSEPSLPPVLWINPRNVAALNNRSTYAASRSLSAGELHSYCWENEESRIRVNKQAITQNVEVHTIDVPRKLATYRKAAKESTLVMKYLVPVLLVLVGIKYQVKPNILFLENLVQVWCFIGATCLYWATLEVAEKMKNSDHISITKVLPYFAFSVKVLSVISLVSMVFPHHVSLLVFIVLTSLVTLSLALAQLYVVFRTQISNICGKILSRVTRV